MLKAVILSVLTYLPAAAVGGMLCFLFARWILGRGKRAVRTVASAGILLCLLFLVAGMVYGGLRFGGVILNANDYASTLCHFDTSYRDAGFRCAYACAAVFVGIGAAFLHEKSKGRKHVIENEAK